MLLVSLDGDKVNTLQLLFLGPVATYKPDNKMSKKRLFLVHDRRRAQCRHQNKRHTGHKRRRPY